jgi:pimeloyl-ACP methyl ester carboxylesterase
VTRPRLLLVPSFTELEWGGIRPQLREWADVATFDPPGVGTEPMPPGLRIEPDSAGESLPAWRQAAAERGWREVEARGWVRLVVVGDSHGSPTAVRIARTHPEAVVGLALGHAALSTSTEGERAPMRAGVWDALIQLATQGNEALVRYGIAQMTRGGVSDQLAEEMIERFPDMDLISWTLQALKQEPEPIGDDLAALADAGIPLLLAKHEGCLGRTDEGFEDIVITFPQADTAVCPETCTASPVFAEALERFCLALDFEASAAATGS